MIFISVFTSCAAAQSGSLLNTGFGHRLQFNKKSQKMCIGKHMHKGVPVHHGSW